MQPFSHNPNRGILLSLSYANLEVPFRRIVIETQDPHNEAQARDDKTRDANSNGNNATSSSTPSSEGAATQQAHGVADAGRSRAQSGSQGQARGKSVRSFYSSQRSSTDPRSSAAAAKAASMWPGADSVANANRASKPTHKANEKSGLTQDSSQPKQQAASSAALAHASHKAAPNANETRNHTSASDAASTGSIRLDDSASHKAKGSRASTGSGKRELKGSRSIDLDDMRENEPNDDAEIAEPAHSAKEEGAAKHSPDEHPSDEHSSAKHSPDERAKPKLDLKLALKRLEQLDKRNVALGAAVAAAALIIIALAVVFAPITVTVNGKTISLVTQKNLEGALQQSGLTPTPGNLVAVDGSLLEEGAGNPFSAIINGEKTSDPATKLSGGETIELGDGENVIEEYTASVEVAPCSATIEGTGAVHRIDAGESGEQEVRVGATSGLQATTITKEPADAVCSRYNVDAGGEKAIALTFDDGPSDDYTPQILDILKENGAAATFFTIGYQIEGTGADIVKRAYDEGHQICTHTWDHAGGSGQGVNLSYMTPQEQVDEVLKGYDAIKAATGADASTVIRTPGGNFPAEVVANLSTHITYEIGWNIDTYDWQKPGVASIRSAILSAQPGSIILMHDGGGNRAQTVQALAEALPQLTEEGYSFVTVDELLELSQQDQGDQ